MSCYSGHMQLVMLCDICHITESCYDWLCYVTFVILLNHVMFGYVVTGRMFITCFCRL